MFNYNPKWQKLSKLYKINDSAFQGQYALKNSDMVKQFILPTDTMEDPKNPKKEYLWERYKQSALYTNYPYRYLKQAIGLATKEKYELLLPDVMRKIQDYASIQNLNLQQIFVQILTNVIKFGSALIITKIPDEVNIASDYPRIEIIPGCDVLDGQTSYDKEKGLDVFKRLVYYKQEYQFNYQTNQYNLPEIWLYILGIDEQGNYYQAKLKQPNYSKFDFKNPLNSKDICKTLSFPKWYTQLKYIPTVYVNKENLKLEWKESPIQNLIQTSLSIFQMTADMRFLMHQQSSSTLIISGTDMEGKSIRTGIGNVINLVDSGSKGQFIAPSVAGLQAMQTCLDKNHELAQNELLTLSDIGGNSSGQALGLRISDKTNELVGLVLICGKALQRELELIGNLMNVNIDQIVFEPYIGFGKLQSEKIQTNSVNQ